MIRKKSLFTETDEKNLIKQIINAEGRCQPALLVHLSKQEHNPFQHNSHNWINLRSSR